MSKVKIQGNASGTGVLTVTAPNTSTDRTITLPDATGTLLNSDGDGSSLTGVADATKLPLTGGTVTGALNLSGTVDNTVSGTLVVKGNLNANQTSALTLFQEDISNSAIRVFGADAGDTGTLNVYSAASDGSPNTKIISISADGLKFNGDTAAANALDDYEEGTWTPVIFGVTKTNQGYYTKVGRMVTITFCNQAGMTLNDGDKADIGGLPFSKIDSNWETGSVPSACFSDATSSYNHRVMTGRQKSNNYIELVNRSGVGMTTSDPMQMTMTYHTS